jgi:hypothetical protein
MRGDDRTGKNATGLSSFRRGSSFRGVNDAEFERVVRQFTDRLENVDTRIDDIFKAMNNKIDKDELESLTANKISKDEIGELLPDMDIQDAKIKDEVEHAIEGVWSKLNEKLKNWDNRIVTLRQEFDIDHLNKVIGSKAVKD